MQYKSTTKLFYGEFPYKAVLHHQGLDVDEWYANMRKLMKWLRLLPKNDFRVRQQNRIQLFFKWRKDLVDVLDKNHKFVSEVHEPFNKKHYEYLMDNKDCITRNTLFWSKYRYKITFSNARTLSSDWFQNFFKERDPARYRYGASMSKMLRVKGQYEHYWCNPVLYLAEKDDVVLCKLAMQDKIIRLETAVTFDEFKEDKI